MDLVIGSGIILTLGRSSSFFFSSLKIYLSERVGENLQADSLLSMGLDPTNP